MARHIVFLIHGIGIHEPEWGEEVDGPIKTLQKVSQQYAYFQKPGQTLGDKVEFVAVDYDDVFHEIITKWQQDASSITQFDVDNVLKKSELS